MSDWITQVQNHQVHTTISSILSILGEIRSQIEDLSADATAKVLRVNNVVSQFNSKLSTADPDMLRIAVLDNANANLGNISNELSAYVTNRNEAHIQKAHSYLDSVLQPLSNLVTSGSVDDLNAIRDAAITLRRSAGQHMHYLNEEAEEIKGGFNSISNRVEQIETKLRELETSNEATITNFTAASKEAESNRQIEFNNSLNGFTERISKLIDGHEKRLEEIKENYNSLWHGLNEELSQKNQQSVEHLKAEANQILQFMDDRKTDAERIAGIITDTGLVGGYQRVANEERTACTLWKGVAALSFVGLIAFAVFLFTKTLDEGFHITLEVTATRIFSIGGFALLAGYAARQGDKHERAERHYRKMELDLASITPYLYEFPEDQTQEIKKELAQRMFAQGDFFSEKKESKGIKKEKEKLMEYALEIIKSLGEKGP